MRFLIAACLILVFCNSCTIEKRLYGRGYHVTWHKRYKTVKGDEKKKKLEPEEVVEEETIDSTEIVPEPEELTAETSEQEIPDADSLKLTKEEKKKARREKYPDLPKAERKFEPLGVLAFKILLVNIPVGIIGENTTSQRLIAQCELLFLAILIVSFVLAIISMVRYLRNPRHYKFNIFAIVVILVGLFYLVEFILGNAALLYSFKMFMAVLF